MRENMDWSAVALLLAERADLPALLLSRSGEVLLVASAAERALGWAYDSVGSDWIERHVPRKNTAAARWLLEMAASGALRRVELEVITGQGPALATFEAYSVVGHDTQSGVLLLLEKVVALTPEAPAHDYDYDVQELTTGVFTLRSVLRLGALNTAAAGCCYEVLHGRSTHCEQCPLRGRSELTSPQAVVELVSDREYRVTSALRTGGNLIRVSVRRLPSVAFLAIFEAKLTALSIRSRLSQRERAVLRQLIEGHTLDDIAQSLSITARTVRFHQANLLQKLGADSRADLMRLIL